MVPTVIKNSSVVADYSSVVADYSNGFQKKLANLVRVRFSSKKYFSK
jgi:hypothetical protein